MELRLEANLSDARDSSEKVIEAEPQLNAVLSGLLLAVSSSRSERGFLGYFRCVGTPAGQWLNHGRLIGTGPQKGGMGFLPFTFACLVCKSLAQFTVEYLSRAGSGHLLRLDK